MSGKESILLLEDDEVLAPSLVELLEMEGFLVTHCEDAACVLEKSFREKFSLYIFDVNVPDINGFELLKSLREADDTTPALFLTALADVASIAEGFEVGADEYIKKPFDFDELVVRITALLKRQYKTYTQECVVGEFAFHIEKNELYKNGEFVSLAPTELKLVKIFFQNLNQTLPKEFLLQELSYDTQISEGSLRVYINKLRKLSLPLTTVKGIGYRLGTS